jgi:two-component system LytT family sensor kinase
MIKVRVRSWKDAMELVLKWPLSGHLLFWFFVAVLLTLLEGTEAGFAFVFINELINVFFFGILVYFNFNYLIPNYLTRNQFLTYAVLLSMATMIITPLKAIMLYLRFADYPQTRSELIQNLNWYFLVHFFVAGASTVVKIIAEWARQVREKQELEHKTMQSELRFLKSQINPHFLFNTLNNLYALTLKKSDDAPEIVIKLSEMMRYMLYDCNERQVSLKKEINYIQNYLDLERLRQSKDAEIRFEVEGETDDQQIAPLLFIPFLENSFKHGMTDLLGQGYVHIHLTAQQEQVNFSIENTKLPARPSQGAKRSGGIGLENIRRRLQLLYPGKYTLKIEETPNTYRVSLVLQLNHENQ